MVMVASLRQHIGIKEISLLLDELFEPLNRIETSDIFDDRCMGRRLHSDVVSLRNIPHYPASAVDGYAVRASDTAHASTARPVRLTAESVHWVNTGGWVPEPYDAVVMIEDITEEDGTILLSRAVSKGTNVRPVGEDISRGQIIGRKKERITPYNKALFAAAGYRRIQVLPLPRTLFIPTGDEIRSLKTIESEGDLRPGTVPETNSLLLSGIFNQWGYPLDVHPDVLPDDPDVIENTVREVLGDYDMILLGAGTAKGKRDYSAEIISSVGELNLRWIRMKPGRPVILGKASGKPLLALPGFPMSALVATWAFVYPILKLLEGSGPAREIPITEGLGSPEKITTKLLVHHSSSQGIAEWLRVKCADIDGEKYSWIMPSGSSTMWSIAEADGFSLLPENALEHPKGSPLQVWMVKKVDWEKRALYQGSNDPGIERLPSFVKARGAEMVIRSVGSLGGVMALARGEGHMAACHLLDPESGRYNTPYIESLPGADEWKRIHVYNRLQGFLVPRGNPKGLRNVNDLEREDVSIVNRQSGAGTRVLLDALLAEAHISCQNVRGYETIAITHLDAAGRVAANAADTALAIKAVADAMDLDFIPVAEEPFELYVPRKFLDHPGVAASLDALEDPSWRKVVEAMGGYIWKN
ncbi:MAG: Molybdenum cofactor synthesis domain protein [Synergistales bacterium 53_16]|jgi:putative molybdopterin biosynthesis protein|nr:MAG: Molybdenum cofactor synthesis domain protein [Synergistales bacterium 53_16]